MFTFAAATLGTSRQSRTESADTPRAAGSPEVATDPASITNESVPVPLAKSFVTCRLPTGARTHTARVRAVDASEVVPTVCVTKSNGSLATRLAVLPG